MKNVDAKSNGEAVDSKPNAVKSEGKITLKAGISRPIARNLREELASEIVQWILDSRAWSKMYIRLTHQTRGKTTKRRMEI